MSSKSNNFIQIPRSLTSHPAVKDAPVAQRWVLVMLIEGAAFLPCDFCDHGKMMKVDPGQIVITRRGFAKTINVEENDVRRALDRFQNVGILTHKVTHTKTVVTITHADTYNLIKQYSDPRSDPRVTQEWPKSDPEKDKEIIDTEIKKIDHAIFFDFDHGEFQNIQDSHRNLWRQTYPAANIETELLRMKDWLLNPDNPKRKGNQSFITNWLNRSSQYAAPNKQVSKKPAEPALNGEPRFRAKRHLVGIVEGNS